MRARPLSADKRMRRYRRQRERPTTTRRMRQFTSYAFSSIRQPSLRSTRLTFPPQASRRLTASLASWPSIAPLSGRARPTRIWRTHCSGSGIWRFAMRSAGSISRFPCTGSAWVGRSSLTALSGFLSQKAVTCSVQREPSSRARATWLPFPRARPDPVTKYLVKEDA